MISFYELIDRTMVGKYCPPSEFEMGVLVPKIEEVVSKYKIKADPKNPVPSDDDLADRVFQAAFELLRDVGIYCPDSERLVQFSEAELREAVAEAPSAPVFGQGKDAKPLVARKTDSDSPPWCFVGAGGNAVSSEELYASLMETYASFLPLADSITGPTLASINGRRVRTGTPLEVKAAIRATVLAREALRRGGRPGLSIMNSIATAGSDTAKIAGSQFGLKPSDVFCTSFSAELKLEYQRYNEVAFAQAVGAHVVAGCGPVYGGYCGGGEGMAVINVAYHLASIIALRGSCQLTFPIHFKYGCNTEPGLLWAYSVSTQAISRNSHFPVLNLSYVAAGPMTEMCLYEIAAGVTASVVSGASGIEFGGVAKCTHMDHCTPMEPRLASEVAHAVAGMTRKEANEIVKKLLPHYEGHLDNPPIGKKYEECWDIHRKTPNDEYVTLYQKIKKDLGNLGIRT